VASATGDLGLHHDGQLDRPATGGRSRTGQESFEERSALPIVHGPAGDDQDVHVTGRSEPADHRGPVQVGADGIGAEHIVNQPYDPLNLIHRGFRR
jgi:hypothetical protein